VSKLIKTTFGWNQVSVGAIVGDRDGRCDGSWLGSGVGGFDGEAVGCSDGRSVGVMEGAAEGSEVGKVVGASVGHSGLSLQLTTSVRLHAGQNGRATGAPALSTQLPAWLFVALPQLAEQSLLSL
jgi:hypothetical protein